MRDHPTRNALCEEYMVCVRRATGGWIADSLMRHATDDSHVYRGIAETRSGAEDDCLNALAVDFPEIAAVAALRGGEGDHAR